MKRYRTILLTGTILVLLNLHFTGLTFASSEMWSKTYGSNNYDVATSLVETSDDGFLLAGYTDDGFGFYSDVMLVKTDAQGNMKWQQTYSKDDQDFAYSVVKTPDAGFAVAGSSGSALSGRPSHFWLIKTDAYGNVEWNQTYIEGTCRSVVVTPDGGFAMAGSNCLVKTDSYGNLEWNQTYKKCDIRSLIVTLDEGYALAGFGNKDDLGYYTDFWFAKIDLDGNLEWNQTYGNVNSESSIITGNVYDLARSLVETSDGGFVLLGSTSGGVLGNPRDAWLIKTDGNGNVLWNKTYGGEDYEDAFSLIETFDGGLAFTGLTRSFGSEYSDVWLVKTDSQGAVEWNQTYGGKGFDGANSLIISSDGGFALAGYKESDNEGDDFFLVKTDAQGIPEFQGWTIAPLLIIVTFAAILCKQRLERKSA